MQLGPPLTGSGVSFMAGSFLLPMGQWQTPGGCHKFSRWGHGEPLKSPYWQFFLPRSHKRAYSGSGAA